MCPDTEPHAMKLPLYQVDAFAARAFEGNPAAVCPLPHWLPDAVLQAIAEENNLSETAFFVETADGYHLRWFTPVAEVDLCGHATLAAAHVIFLHLDSPESILRFHTRSGLLTVQRDGMQRVMDFPAQVPVACPTPPALTAGLGKTPLAVLAAADYIAVFGSEEEIRAITPDFAQLRRLDRRGVCITAPGDDADFVSRFFAPNYGIDEDPVTGSAHCQLMPYWSERLGKTRLRARQVSRRGGEVWCELRGERVQLAGTAVTYLRGEIDIG